MITIISQTFQKCFGNQKRGLTALKSNVTVFSGRGGGGGMTLDPSRGLCPGVLIVGGNRSPFVLDPNICPHFAMADQVTLLQIRINTSRHRRVMSLKGFSSVIMSFPWSIRVQTINRCGSYCDLFFTMRPTFYRHN